MRALLRCLIVGASVSILCGAALGQSSTACANRLRSTADAAPGGSATPEQDVRLIVKSPVPPVKIVTEKAVPWWNWDFGAGLPWYDVKAFGAKCDGVTDDTAAITAAYFQLLADLQANGGNAGGGGAVYYPPSVGPCKVGTLKIPAMPTGIKGWIVSVFDNGLHANGVVPSSFNAFIGRSGNFQGLAGLFDRGPMASWVQNSGVSNPLVDIFGATNTYYEGINFESVGSNDAIHMHDNAGAGPVYTFFKQDMIESVGTGRALTVDSSSPSQTAGFGLFVDNTTFRGGGGGGEGSYSISMTNYGQVNIQHSMISGPGIHVTNAGCPLDADFVLDDILSENLTNQDFLTIDGTYVNDITLRDIKLADPVGTVYMVKDTTTGGPLGPIKFEMEPTGNTASGLIDPASNPFPMYCEGWACPGPQTEHDSGTVTLLGGTATVTFLWPYLYKPSCFANDETTAGAAKAVGSTTSVVITGGPSDEVDWICRGNPY
jgi:hypothetical protein